MSSVKKFSAYILTILVIAIGVFFRVADITARPLHSDEGVNYYFFKNLIEEGYFPYSHENYHGSAYFYLSSLYYKYLGHSEFSLRFSSIFFGLLLTILPLFYTKTLGRRFAFILSCLLALSSSMVFHSRYAIHEMLLVFSTLWLVLSLLDFLLSDKKIALYGAAISLGLMVATKETFGITVFALFCAGMCLQSPKALYQKIVKYWEHLTLALLFFTTTVIISFTGCFQNFKGLHELFQAIPSWFKRGVKTDEGHFKPWQYYLEILLKGEPTLIVGSLLATIIITCLAIKILPIKQNKKSANDTSSNHNKINHNKLSNEYIAKNNLTEAVWPLAETTGQLDSYLSDPGKFNNAALTKLLKNDLALLIFSYIWGLLVLVVYSFIRYKTPWLVINITLPLLFFIAASISILKAYKPVLGKIYLIVFLMGSFFYTAKFNNQDISKYLFAGKATLYGKQNPFSYVHTSKGMISLVKKIKSFETRGSSAPQLKILIAVPQYWPLPFYLHDYKENLNYLTNPVAKSDALKEHEKYDIIILDKYFDLKTTPETEEKWTSQYYRLSEVQEARVYFKKYLTAMENLKLKQNFESNSQAPLNNIQATTPKLDKQKPSKQKLAKKISEKAS